MAAETILEQMARHSSREAKARAYRARRAERRRRLASAFREPGEYEVSRGGRVVARVRVSLVGTNRSLRRIEVIPC